MSCWLAITTLKILFTILSLVNSKLCGNHQARTCELEGLFTHLLLIRNDKKHHWHLSSKPASGKKHAEPVRQEGHCYVLAILSNPVGVKKFEFLHPFSKASEKISISCFSQSCFALNQFYNELTTKKKC